jgi:hypothetical protein
MFHISFPTQTVAQGQKYEHEGVDLHFINLRVERTLLQNIYICPQVTTERNEIK